MSTFSELNNLSLEELKELLKELRLYDSLTKQLGKRGKALYFKLKNGKENFEVEYFPSITKETVLNEAKIAFKKCFGIDIQSNDTIILKPKESLSGGIRIYVDDKTLDLSYRRIEKALEK